MSPVTTCSNYTDVFTNHLKPWLTVTLQAAILNLAFFSCVCISDFEDDFEAGNKNDIMGHKLNDRLKLLLKKNDLWH